MEVFDLTIALPKVFCCASPAITIQVLKTTVMLKYFVIYSMHYNVSKNTNPVKSALPSKVK